MSPSLVLEGEPPRLIDEWQEVPPIWDAVRYKVDTSPDKGLFILTGSATPNHKGILHSGAGRLPAEQASLVAKEYLRAIVDDDVFRMDGIRRNSTKMLLLLHSLARNESTTTSNKTLKNDIKDTDNEDIDVVTVAEYLDIFERLFLTDNIPPFSTSVRSSVRVKQSVKRHFCDPSIACSLLNLTPTMLVNDLETLDLLFEALCERDLKIYAESFGGNLYHYQDYKNREIDAIVEMPDGQWCAFEIKLGANQIDAAAQSLLTIKKEIEDDPKGKPPSILCVLCGMSNAAYQRPDGVFVVPITALKN